MQPSSIEGRQIREREPDQREKQMLARNFVESRKWPQGDYCENDFASVKQLGGRLLTRFLQARVVMEVNCLVSYALATEGAIGKPATIQSNQFAGCIIHCGLPWSEV